MNFAIEVNPFVVGDPIQAILNSNVLGIVTRIIEGQYDWVGSTQMSLVYVRLIGCKVEAVYCPNELRICKCVTRIPKGVSRLEKKNA